MATRAAQAIRGPPVRGGATVRRQSMPSSNTASCAAVNCSAPSTIGGQTNLPFSSRLANRHRPEPSQVKSSRSRRACRGRRRPLPRTDRRREPAPPPPTPVEAAPHVDGLAGEIDFDDGREARSQIAQRRKHQTQNIAVDAFFDANLRAIGKANLHRPEPRRARRLMPQTWRAFHLGRRQRRRRPLLRDKADRNKPRGFARLPRRACRRRRPVAPHRSADPANLSANGGSI